MSKNVRTHIFRGKRYKIRHLAPSRLPDHGRCSGPNDRDKSIDINKSDTDLEELDTYIHEGLHACAWDLDENAVTETSKDIAQFLWRLGYRKVK